MHYLHLNIMFKTFYNIEEHPLKITQVYCRKIMCMQIISDENGIGPSCMTNVK